MDDKSAAVLKLKNEKQVLILAHYYQNPDILDISDHVGDSFALAQLAQSAEEDIIILCGVRFMAESAKILNPEKTVYLPAPDAGCPMADMVTSEDVLRLRREYPRAVVVCYVNSSAAVKAVSDICCTSSSAVQIVKSLPNEEIIFIPDKNLGAYCAKQVPEKKFILFSGCCPIHDKVLESDAAEARKKHPSALFLIHPECRPEVLEHADYVGSTAGILQEANKTDRNELVIGTENGIVDIIKKQMPKKRIFPLIDEFVCPDMKKTSLLDVLACLEGTRVPIELPLDELNGARLSLERMINS